MFLGDQATEFPALLKDERGVVLSEGRASVSREDRSVTFTADFVPLYPVGTPMEIVRTAGDREVHRFTGNCFLSDRRLLRLVSADDQLLPGAEEIYCSGLSLPARLTVPAEEGAGVLRRLFSGAGRDRVYDVTLTALTAREAEFRLDRKPPLEEGQALGLTFLSPLDLPESPVQIVKSLQFGPTPSYLCSLSGLSVDSAQRLRCFLWERVKRECKLF